ncbi:acetyl/propionyl/methylcrotonyl-CoA carboxylase subunit alpha [Nocardiopsis coralliicola]
MTLSSAGEPPAVLVANRGEIAVRIMRTLRRMGLRSVAVYGDGDAGARHVREADAAVRIGGAALADSYLDAAAVVRAAVGSGARYVHPGYGFLSENAAFARACGEAGLVFVGPPPAAIEAMGDKIRAKDAVAAAGVPLLPGFAEEPGAPLEGDALAGAAERTGYPLLIKPSAGGGGKGMRLVRAPGELAEAAAAARREAAASFGDPTLLVERYVEQPRHIEVQVLADGHGTVLHLGERECSLQRRHQKIVEEAPSPMVGAGLRAALGEAAVAAAKACGYVGAGTVEFIVHGGAGPEAAEPEYAFLEMNTRLQVEHPVTEEVTAVRGARGIDLVELQMRIAAGEPLPFGQDDVSWSGHAVECRVYAEDPAREFLPTGGRVLLLSEPSGDGVRVDSGLAEGAEITSAYDPMLAKVIAWAPDRAAALHRCSAALAGFTLLGCGTNTAFLRRLLAHPAVAAGALTTGLTEQVRPELTAGDGEPPAAVAAAAAVDHQLGLEPAAGSDPFALPSGWRPGGGAWTTWRLRAPGRDPVAVDVRRLGPPEPAAAGAEREQDYEVCVDGGAPIAVRAARSRSGRSLTVAAGGRTERYARAAGGGALWIGRSGAAWSFTDAPRVAPTRAAAASAGGPLLSPMPGTVLSVPVSVGDAVSAGDPVVVVEAMKMEHTVRAAAEGTVAELPVRAGDAVAMDAVLAVVAPHGSAAPQPQEAGAPAPP